jgi:hypothetical protein
MEVDRVKSADSRTDLISPKGANDNDMEVTNAPRTGTTPREAI